MSLEICFHGESSRIDRTLEGKDKKGKIELSARQLALFDLGESPVYRHQQRCSAYKDGRDFIRFFSDETGFNNLVGTASAQTSDLKSKITVMTVRT